MSAIRTLVVDDDPAACRLHAAYVDREPGFAVVGSVQDGPTALTTVAERRVDLLLLDIQLPEFSGIEVLHRLRQASPQPVDVIVISSARDRVTVRQALSANVVGYLVKPFSREALNRRLREYRRQRDAVTAANDDTFGQREIDAMLAAPVSAGPASARPELPRELPTGLSRTTLDLVLVTIDRLGRATTMTIAEEAGVSRATARRYLDFLHSRGLLDVSHRYGGRGRPELLYRIAPAR